MKILSSFGDSIQACPIDSFPVLSYCIDRVQIVYETYFLPTIQSLIRPLFFPFLESVPQEMQIVFDKEKQFVENFWNPNTPIRPDIPRHAEIRETFRSSQETIEISLDGCPLTVRYRVIESKGASDNPQTKNLVHVLGISAMTDGIILHTRPFLTAYLDKENRPPLRCILIGHYETFQPDGSVYKPRTLIEAGRILDLTVQACSERYGNIDTLVSHSLGSIVTGAALPFLQKPSASSLASRVSSSHPARATEIKTDTICRNKLRTIVFDRGPASVEELSKKYWGGKILLALASLSGWNIDIGTALARFLTETPTPPRIVVINAKNDHRFGGDCNLSEHPSIRALEKTKQLSRMVFDTPLQDVHYDAHHSIPFDFWTRHRLTEECQEDREFLQGEEDVSQAIIRDLFV